MDIVEWLMNAIPQRITYDRIINPVGQSHCK